MVVFKFFSVCHDGSHQVRSRAIRLWRLPPKKSHQRPHQPTRQAINPSIHQTIHINQPNNPSTHQPLNLPNNQIHRRRQAPHLFVYVDAPCCWPAPDVEWQVTHSRNQTGVSEHALGRSARWVPTSVSCELCCARVRCGALIKLLWCAPFPRNSALQFRVHKGLLLFSTQCCHHIKLWCSCFAF